MHQISKLNNIVLLSLTEENQEIEGVNVPSVYFRRNTAIAVPCKCEMVANEAIIDFEVGTA